jgi:signal transduction histidine kinase
MRPGHWVAIDFAAGVVAALYGLFVATIGENNPAAPGMPLRQHVVFRAVLVVAIFLSVALRRHGPLVAFGVLLAVTAATVEIGSPTSILVMMPAAYVLYMVTVTGTKETGITALGTSLGLIAALMAVTTHRVNAQPSVGILVALAMIIAWIAGYSVRQRRAYAVMLQEQAASNAVAEERLRIARELHDVVAHSMSVIAVQAGYGQYVIDSKPAEASNALGAIQATSRDALDELRRMLGVLRQQDAGAGAGAALPGVAPRTVPGPGVGSPAPGAPTAQAPPPGSLTAGSRAAAPLAPAPGLADLDRLVQRTSGAGVQVSVRRYGRRRDLPAGIDLSAYRIVQEALTNVVRHAGGGTCCTVTVDYREEELAIEVTDDGGRTPVLAGAGVAGMPGRPFAATAGTGHGIIGMRERVNLCGGEFSAGPLPGGGFRVRALLPLGAGTAGEGTEGSGTG